MTALNWEKNAYRSKQKEFIGYELPITGSYADQRRYGVYGAVVRKTRTTVEALCRARSRWDDFDQLKRYSEHAYQSDVKRLSSVQKEEIIRIIRNLLSRCNSWAVAISSEERNLLDKANLLITKWSY